MTNNTADITSKTEAEHSDARNPEMKRREFIKRFGVYTAGSAVGIYVLMSGKTSAVAGSLIEDNSAQQPLASQKSMQYKENPPLFQSK